MNTFLTLLKYGAMFIALAVVADNDTSIGLKIGAAFAIAAYFFHVSETTASERHMQIIQRLEALENKMPNRSTFGE